MSEAAEATGGEVAQRVEEYGDSPAQAAAETVAEKTEVKPEPVVQACEIVNVENESKANPNGALLVFTQTGCGECPPFLREVNDKLGGKVTIIEANTAEDQQCNYLADKFKVGTTPQAFFFKDGQAKGKVDPAGKTYTEIDRELEALLS